MKLLTGLFLILLLFCGGSGDAQVAPEEASAVLIGPVSVDGVIALQVGYSREVFGLWLAGFGQFGKTAEASGEVVKLFQVLKNFYVGPIAGGGVDWSDETGTGGVPVEAYIYGAAGAGATYNITDQIGVWGLYKFRTENKPKIGLGVFLKL